MGSKISKEESTAAWDGSVRRSRTSFKKKFFMRPEEKVI
jgi:hypothetical protein